MHDLQPVRAVTFDVGGTLIEPWPSVGHVYAQVAHRLGHPWFDERKLNEQFAGAWATRDGFDYSRPAWKEIVRDTFRGVLDGADVECLFGELYDHFAGPGPWRIFPDALPALHGLQEAGIRLGLISNWDERLRPLLERLRLSHYFEVIIISEEHGETKPEAELFHKAAEGFGLAPDTVMHVGDCEREDYRGAGEAGMRAGWLRRGGQGACGRGELRSLGEVARLLEKRH